MSPLGGYASFPGGPVLVVGCGLIGTSVGLALRRHDLGVHLSDTDPDNVELAVARGAGTADVVVDPALVVVAVPPAATLAVVEECLAAWPGAVVTDVASVKAPLRLSVGELPGAERYAGGHPMAGSERSGPMAASAQLFEGRPWAVTPSGSTLPAAIDTVVDLALHVGAVPIILDAEAHDRAVAVVSHVPQVMSVLTAARLNDASESHLRLAGPGLRDVTRIAGSDTALWLDILGNNAHEVRTVLQLIRLDLDRVIDALGTDDAGLEAVLESGRQGTRLIPGKHGDDTGVFATVVVSVPDQPGELSRLMTHAGQSGINIEDLRIDHELGRAVGQVEVMVVAERADELVVALTGRGWTAYRAGVIQ